jgi:hypothetical protein
MRNHGCREWTKFMLAKVQDVGALVSAAARLTLALAIAVSAAGCAEATFDLAEESRLPKWFDIPAGLDRRDLTVRMSYYGSLSSQRRAVFTMYGRNGDEVGEVTGSLQGTVPISDVPHKMGERLPYPGYEVVSANGITEVIEHRERGPVFHVCDDPVVRAKVIHDREPQR